MTKRANPAVSAAQYGMAQAVLSGASTGMPVSVARELVEKTPHATRSKFARELAGNPVEPMGLASELVRELHRRDLIDDHGGRVIELMMRRTGMSYSEALAVVAKAAKVDGRATGQGIADAYQKMYASPAKKAQLERLHDLRLEGMVDSKAYRPRAVTLEKLGRMIDMKLGKGKKPNPESDAASMYESFHGTPSTGELVIQDQIHYHGNLAELGVLCGLKVRVVTGEDFTLEFGTPGREANPKGKGKRKRSKRGPLTTAYSTAQGIVPGLLGIGDSAIRGVVGNPQKWILPHRRGRKNYENVGYLPYALEHDIGFSGSKMYRPVKVGADNQITVMSSELSSVDYDRYSRKSVIDAIKELAKRSRGENPRRVNPDGGPVILCSNETGNQLYFRGGDQSLDLDSLNLADAARDHMVIGEVWALAYSTKKDFDEFAEIEYVHTLGLEKYHVKLPAKADLWEDAQPPKDDAFSCGNLPTLMYDSMNKSLSIAGGIYKIEKPWAETSPGIEN